VLTIPLCFYPLGVKYNGGLALLAAILKDRGIGTDLCMLSSESEFLRRLVGWPGPFVCFSAVTHLDYLRSVPYMRLAKDAGKTVLVGGTWAGLGRPVDDAVDYICRGDGESLADFFCRGDDRLFRERIVTADLNALPLPDYAMWRGIPFDRGLPETDGLYCLPYLSSRGCPYPCTFCQIRQQAPGMRLRTRCEEDLSRLTAEYHPDLWFVGDALLPYHSEAWRASWGNFRAPFVGYIRADATPDQLGWLIDRGMKGCAFGVESGDEGYRNRVLRKGLTDDEVWRTVDILKRAGCWYVPYFMYGTPGETMAIRTKTARMARTIGRYAVTWAYEEL